MIAGNGVQVKVLMLIKCLMQQVKKMPGIRA